MKHFLFLIIILLAAPLTAQQNEIWSRWKGELPPPGVSQRLGSATYHDFSNGVSGISQRLGSATYHDFSNGVSGISQ